MNTHHPGRSRPRWSWRGGRRPAATSAPCCPTNSCEFPRPPPLITARKKILEIIIYKNIFIQNSPEDERRFPGIDTSPRYTRRH